MRLSCWLLLGASVLTGAATGTSAATYDEQLCGLAQRMLVNADGAEPAPFEISVLRGVSNGLVFHKVISARMDWNDAGLMHYIL